MLSPEEQSCQIWFVSDDDDDTMQSLPSVTGRSTRQVTILLINPNTSAYMTDACLRSIQPTLPANTSVYGFTCPKSGPSAVEGKVDATLSAADCFRALAPLLRDSSADSVRFDGFLVACFSAHPLIGMLREEYSQPTIGIMEAALYASRMCGDSLGIVTTSERSSRIHGKSIVDYGLEAYSVGCETGHISVLELDSQPKAIVYAGIATAAQKLVEKGGDCICLGCAGMTELQGVCRAAVGMDEGKAMIVDGVAMGVHFLAALAREGLGTAKVGVYRSAAAGRERRGQDWL